MIINQRKVYSFLNVLSELGGTANVLFAFIRMIMGSFIYQSFLISNIKKLYNVKIDNDYFFGKKSKKVKVNFNG